MIWIDICHDSVHLVSWGMKAVYLPYFAVHCSITLQQLSKPFTFFFYCFHDVINWDSTAMKIDVNEIRFREYYLKSLHKKWSCGFGHIYWRNPYWKTSFFCAVHHALCILIFIKEAYFLCYILLAISSDVNHFFVNT